MERSRGEWRGRGRRGEERGREGEEPSRINVKVNKEQGRGGRGGEGREEEKQK